MKRRTTRRLLSLLLSASLVFSLSGVMALADEVEADNEVSAVEAADEIVPETVEEVASEEVKEPVAEEVAVEVTAIAEDKADAAVAAPAAAIETVDVDYDIQVLADGEYNTYEGQLGSFNSGGTSDDDNDYLFTAALFVMDGAIQDEYSNFNMISSGTYTDNEADGVVIIDSESGHNGIIVKDVEDYTINNAYIVMNTDADGTDTCDFSGKGSAIAIYGSAASSMGGGGGFPGGEGGPPGMPMALAADDEDAEEEAEDEEITTNVTINDSYIETSGVATMPIFVDSGAVATIKNSTLISNGGTLAASIMNSPDQAAMVAPPWILGIMGNSRCTNLMGNGSVMNVLDSDTSAGAWAVLSTDSGSDMILNIYNTSLTLNNVDESAAAPLQAEGGEISETLDNPYTYRYGSGYGTYVIGDAVETFAGATVNVGTYGSIFTGGTATYTNIEAGQSYELEGGVTYTAPESKSTVINSDTFGFMFHQENNYITIENGTQVNSGYATFLVKTGGSSEQVEATIDDAVIKNGGVLIQLMDNDDDTNGGMMSTDDPLNTNGSNMNFIPYHAENAGFNTDENTAGNSVQSFTFTNGIYKGNIYNASGSDNSDYGPLSGSVLNVTLGEGADLMGAAASTSAIHVTYDGSKYVKDVMGGAAFDDAEAADAYAADYQNVKFTIEDYFDIGQVANLVNYNGGNDINIDMTDDATWYVTGTSVISTLSVADSAAVTVPNDVVLTVGDEEYSGVIIMADGEIAYDEPLDTGWNDQDDEEVSEGYNTYEGQLGSFNSGGTSAEDNDYLFTAALFVMDNAIQPQYSNYGLITAGSYDDNSADGVTIIDSTSGHNGIIIKDVEDYTINNAYIVMDTDADGTDTCDFSGKGSAIAIYGSAVSSMGGMGGGPGGEGGFPGGDMGDFGGMMPFAAGDEDAEEEAEDDEIITNVTINDSYIETSGVATMPIFVDSGAIATINNSTLKSQGGTLASGIMNSPDQAAMVAPPWILGIMGNSRCTNLMGNGSVMNVLDSETYAGAWAVLSTDSGSDMILNIYNTSLELMNADESAAAPLQAEGGEISETLDNPYTTNYGSGYGTYVIGDAVETFAGATVNVGTYGSIFTGGSATYTNIEAGQTYSLDGGVVYEAPVTKNTVINSDTFGFMFHQSNNYITIEKGTKVNSDYATFLVKTGGSSEQVEATIDDAVINNGGVLIQIMDNDDDTNGGMMSTDDPLNTNGSNMNFIPYHAENAGFNTDENTAGNSVQSFTFTNGTYKGNIYNASGSDNSNYGPLSGSVLNVTLGEGADLMGAAASTAAIHVTYDGSEYVKNNMYGEAFDDADAAAEYAEKYQNTYFTINNYYDIGQVANLVNYNGGNDINMTLTDDATWYVTSTSVISTLSVDGAAAVTVPTDVVLIVGDEEYSGVIITAEGTEEYDEPLDPTWRGYNTYEGQLGSFGSGGTSDEDNDYLFTAALFVMDDAIQPQYSNFSLISSGTYDDTQANDVEIIDSESGHNGIIIKDVEDYTINNAHIVMDTDADGTDTCDFSGKGSAIAIYGSAASSMGGMGGGPGGEGGGPPGDMGDFDFGMMPFAAGDEDAEEDAEEDEIITNVTINDSYIETSGVATMPIFVDSGAVATINNSTLISHGGTLASGIMNSPDQAAMVSPPWILGIMGNSRCTNLMGNGSIMNVLDSDTYSGAWAVLSTDSGSDMILNIYGTTLELMNVDESAAAPLQAEGGEISETLDNPYTYRYGSGYGTYVIGDAVETFAGATVNVGTYGSIFTGGSATYTNIVKGQTYELDGGATYTASESKNTVINSDTFGFMIHQSDNFITIENGTEVNSDYATFLVKSGGSNEQVTATVDDATINNGGVLIQVMDNDDDTNGGMMSTDDPLNTNGGNMNFVPYHAENEGFNTDQNEAGSAVQTFTFTNGYYTGNIYNASGSDNSNYGPLNGSTLDVTLGAGATLNGAVASTAAIHVTYAGSEYVKNVMGGAAFDDADEAAAYAADYQNTYFTINNYYDIGQVANLVNYNGGNDIIMTLTDDAVWNVTDTSVIGELVVTGDAEVYVPNGVILTVDGEEYEGVLITEGGIEEIPEDYETPDTGNGGSASGSSTGNPKTADNNALYLYLVLIVLAGAAIASVSVRRRYVNR